MSQSLYAIYASVSVISGFLARNRTASLLYYNA